MELSQWVTSYGQAWEVADEDLIVSLFTETATYRSSPFRDPYRGHVEIRAYWRASAAGQRQTRVHMGLPIAQGERVMVEWWATMVEHDRPVTLPGCLLLRMAADGRCSDLREYWNRQEGHSDPFPGWGT
jgi:hypothetical protein